jgi:beta-alanine--pyruvate transaminase
VTPDIITCAKGLTNGAIPMGAVLVSGKIYEAFMQGAPGAIELFHGYTYSAHPAACAAGLATLAIYEREQLLTRARQTAPAFEQALHALRGLPHVIDIRNYGLVGAIELDPMPGSPGARAFGVYLKCFERGLLIRTTGDIIALSPSLIFESKHIDELTGILSQALKD